MLLVDTSLYIERHAPAARATCKIPQSGYVSVSRSRLPATVAGRLGLSSLRGTLPPARDGCVCYTKQHTRKALGFYCQSAEQTAQARMCCVCTQNACHACGACTPRDNFSYTMTSWALSVAPRWHGFCFPQSPAHAYPAPWGGALSALRGRGGGVHKLAVHKLMEVGGAALILFLHERKPFLRLCMPACFAACSHSCFGPESCGSVLICNHANQSINQSIVIRVVNSGRSARMNSVCRVFKGFASALTN